MLLSTVCSFSFSIDLRFLRKWFKGTIGLGVGEDGKGRSVYLG